MGDVPAWYDWRMNLATLLAKALADPLAKEAEAWATERLDRALASLVDGLERGWDRRGLRFWEKWLRAGFYLRHWKGEVATATGRAQERARRKVKRWERRERIRKARALSAPPFMVGDLWITAAEVMGALAE